MLVEDAISEQFFSFETWDSVDEAMYMFYDVVLKTSIGKFQPGTKIKSAFVDFQHGRIELYNETGNEVLAAHKLLYLIGEKC